MAVVLRPQSTGTFPNLGQQGWLLAACLYTPNPPTPFPLDGGKGWLKVWFVGGKE